MSPSQALLLFLAGLFAGGLNALAGGGGFITLPALIFTGATPILANTSGTVAVWPGIVGSMIAYRKHLQTKKHPLVLYFFLALIGSSIGATLLLISTNIFFSKLLPFLLLFASLLFIYGKQWTAFFLSKKAENISLPKWVIYSLLFLIAIYGGYFGGGMGIMTLAVLSLIGMDQIHEMNAVKTLLVLVINGVGATIFIVTGKVLWSHALVMSVGCLFGGYLAGNLVQKVNPIYVRRLIATIAVSMTVYFFYKAF